MKKELLFEKFKAERFEIKKTDQIMGGAWDTRSVSVCDDANGSKVYRDDSSSGAVEHWESDAPRGGCVIK